MNKMVKFRFNFGAVSIFLKVSHHVVLIRDSQNDILKNENLNFKFYSLYPHVPLCKSSTRGDLLSNVCTPLQYSHWQKLILSTTVAVSKVPPRKTDRDRQVMHYSET